MNLNLSFSYVAYQMYFLFLQFCIGTIKDDFLGVINDPTAG